MAQLLSLLIQKTKSRDGFQFTTLFHIPANLPDTLLFPTPSFQVDIDAFGQLYFLWLLESRVSTIDRL